jgi:hypothetical protein
VESPQLSSRLPFFQRLFCCGRRALSSKQYASNYRNGDENFGVAAEKDGVRNKLQSFGYVLRDSHYLISCRLTACLSLSSNHFLTLHVRRNSIQLCIAGFLLSLPLVIIIISHHSTRLPNTHRHIRNPPQRMPEMSPPPPHGTGKKCLALDLDETLVHSSFQVDPTASCFRFYLASASQRFILIYCHLLASLCVACILIV